MYSVDCHHPHRDIDYFHHPKMFCFLFQPFPSSCFHHLNYWSTLRCNSFAFSRDSYKWNHTVHILFPLLLSPKIIILRFRHVLCVSLFFILVVSFWIHIVIFKFGAIGVRLLQTFQYKFLGRHVFISLVWRHRSGFPGSYSKGICNFL